MREILFRGKRLNDEENEWAYGSYVKQYDCDMIYFPTAESDGFDYAHIIPETVGQYTGLTDKNGKKIFEGDIVAIDHTIRTYRWDEIPETYKPRRSYSYHWDEKRDEFCYKRNYAVEWKKKDARWILRNGSDQHNLTDTFSFFHNGIIIGNIHDNPELLKGEETDA